MKISTLHKIARKIHSSIGTVEKRTVNQMTEAIDHAASDATTQREAAYLIATEVFDLIDHEDEDRRRIDSILSEFPGTWQPAREEAPTA